jgi:hypothetical protein
MQITARISSLPKKTLRKNYGIYIEKLKKNRKTINIIK